jgi:hypothetical protein
MPAMPDTVMDSTDIVPILEIGRRAPAPHITTHTELVGPTRWRDRGTHLI